MIKSVLFWYPILWSIVVFAGFGLMILYYRHCRGFHAFHEDNIPSQSDDQQINTRRNQVVLRPTILNGLPTAPVQDQYDQQRRTMRQLQVNLRPYEVSIVNSVDPSAPSPRYDPEDLPPSYEEAVKIIFSKS